MTDVKNILIISTYIHTHLNLEVRTAKNRLQNTKNFVLKTEHLITGRWS